MQGKTPEKNISYFLKRHVEVRLHEKHILLKTQKWSIMNRSALK